MRLQLELAFVLHSRAYRNTSLLVDLLTRGHGRLTVVAKGVRQAKSADKALLQPFNYLYISGSGRGELLTLTAVERAETLWQGLSGHSLFSGLYLNELLLRLLPRNDPHELLFVNYLECLECLANTPENIESALRSFELNLLTELGYGLALERDADTGDAIDLNTQYYYDIERGPVSAKAVTAIASLPLTSGRALQALATKTFDDRVCLREMKMLIRRVLHHHLGGKPLKSRELFFK